ncbi:MAG: NAD(P)/FAD-dependent oxidoreductase, partial [Dehalococcoidia bacterium]|nr:NAD(P)/FAD-dependent oxidoreductase [Dehalococcoidia bacterium]
MDVDVVVIGAGVVGLACAAALARPSRSVLTLERGPTFGHGASSRNSEVVHSGVYYQPGSLKARLAVAGNARLRALAADPDWPVTLRPCGKLIVAVTEDEVPALRALVANGTTNGVPGLRLIDADETRALEPNVRAVAAIHVPTTAVIDSHALMRWLLARAQDGGAQVVYHTTVVAAEPIAGGYRVTAQDAAGARETLTTRAVVNAAGLWADQIAALPGLDIDAAGYRQEFVKGNYCVIGNGKARLVSRLVYPAPVYHGVQAAELTAFAGLGVHLTVSVDGRARLGPDVEYLPDRVESYAPRADIARAFYQSARAFLPFLEPDDVTPESAGIRPKRVAARQGFADFVIAEESARGLPGWVNLIGIESP